MVPGVAETSRWHGFGGKERVDSRRGVGRGIGQRIAHASAHVDHDARERAGGRRRPHAQVERDPRPAGPSSDPGVRLQSGRRGVAGEERRGRLLTAVVEPGARR